MNNKLKIRKTGEIIDIISYTGSTDRSDYDAVSYIDSKGKEHIRVPMNYYWDLENVEDTNINWKKEELELSKEVLRNPNTDIDKSNVYFIVHEIIQHIRYDEVKVDLNFLVTWYIDSVNSKDTPKWTEEHLKKLNDDFILIPRYPND